MNTLRLFTAFACFFLFFSCVENEVEFLDILIDIQPMGSVNIEPEVYGPLFPGRISSMCKPQKGSKR